MFLTKIDIELNTKGQVCPMPAALTRKALKEMISGQIIEIKGDFELAIDNVINMINKNAGEILETEKKENYFRVLAKKI